jgi:threonine dehydrogenase-like Zn-dependent dehydrogenase
VVLLGVHFEPVPISFLQLIAREITFKGSFGYSFEEFKEVLKRLGEKRYQTELMTTTVKLEKSIQTFERLGSPDKKAVKVLVEI